MEQRFRTNIKSLLDLANPKMLVAVSGGLDSVVLTHLLRRCGFEFSIAHMNYKLRGTNSDLDATFVSELATELGAPFHSIVSPLDAKASGIQEKARDLRYAWFSTLREKHKFDVVLTAHHANDQLETLFMRLSRGSGIDGLGGIRPENGFLIRPLLPFFKAELMAYAKKHNLIWREDASNATTKYLRNAIRHKVIPAFSVLSPETAANTLRAMHHMRETSEAIAVQTASIKTQWQQANETTVIPLTTIVDLNPQEFWLFQLFSPYGFDVNEIQKLLKSHSGKKCESATHQLILEREHLALSSLSEKSEVKEQYLVPKAGIASPIRLQISIDACIQKATNVALFDEEKLSFPLILRRWNEGDFFYPTGMKGKKKLSKFFKDEKMSAQEKKNQWVLCNKNDVIWVIDRRVDRRFASNDQSHSLQIKLV